MNQNFGDEEKIINLIPTKSDVELAEEIKKDLAEAYQHVVAAFDKAKSLGFDCQVSVGSNAFKKHFIQKIMVVKLF